MHILAQFNTQYVMHCAARNSLRVKRQTVYERIDYAIRPATDAPAAQQKLPHMEHVTSDWCGQPATDDAVHMLDSQRHMLANPAADASKPSCRWRAEIAGQHCYRVGCSGACGAAGNALEHYDCCKGSHEHQVERNYRTEDSKRRQFTRCFD